ncbi:hypothetical protein E1A91_D10G270100v1 [Gossypium mustelinum]|uniref:Uncharacterized protein n=1 Tax=Gossypium mustelinum TaxID=34275 RepID=A0A5D2TBP4_GOSMU|nr:hypothetical protein E1A91_D10G270100v1 [Gossypium mustelinum]TYI62760.1 hypothetical protein E1A91_D10G270100v1 [Gossypium mustelinum]TYI62761.1 hypothetical protein E1A91_D10G270100v1 [Gossypium mustelinum]
MESVIGIVSSIFTKAAEYAISPIINHVKYLSNHQQNVEILKDEAKKLKDERDRVQHSVDAAQRNGEEIERDVNNWMSAVDRKIPEQVEKVMQDEEKAKKKCFIGLCPNFWTRYKHSLKAAAEAKAVAKLLEQGKFDRVSYLVPLQSIIVPPGKGYEEFESRTSILNGIMEALKDDSVSVVGVHGMGGIGKTILVKEIARKVKGKLFDSVVMATVTQAIDIEKIQNQFADFLGLIFEEESMVGKAFQLRERLKKEERVLVILDDIWGKKVDIEEVGIPLGDEHKGCKLLLTSRELNVLSNGMDAQKNFPIGFLNEKEAWDLFKKKAGNCDESCNLKPIAMEVAKKCAGLPIAIATVAGALRNKRLFEWKNALQELERPSSSNFTGIAAAYSAIELSFNYLESEEVKLTFLLCSVIGHNGLVEDLVRYTLGLGLFDGVHTMEEARNKVLTVVANLKASALLLDSYNDKRFDIHDVVWDAAIAIALKDYRMLVLRDHAPKEWSDKEKMKTWNVISLRCPQIIANLPKEMECSGLSFFRMAYDGAVKIPPNFFKQTEDLKVLDLFGMQFPSLPESIIHLTDLRMLCLKECAVDDISILGELKYLEILDLSKSGIKELPKEMAQLTQLRLLDLRWCRELKIFPPNILSGLSKLEELYMRGSFVEWEKGGIVENERKNASLDELNNLPCLTTLYVHILDVQMIPKHRFVETLDRFKIFVGNYGAYNCFHNYESPKTLKLKLYTNIVLDNGMKMLLIKTEDLCLEGLEGVKNVFVELNNGKDLPNLKRLHVKNGRHVQYIKTNKIGFSELCFIKLENLPQLVSFCSPDERCSTKPLLLFNKQTCHWVTNLRSLIIKGCGKLEHLLSPSLARSLVQLHRFEIEDCDCLRDIIVTEEIEEERKDVICFPRLNSLHIDRLPNLIFFNSGNHNIEFPLLKELRIRRCPKLIEFISQNSNQSGMHALFSEKVAVPSLEKLNIWDLNVKMIFYNDLAPGSFKNLREIIVCGCGTKDLPQLELLCIRGCRVEEIVSKGDGVEEQPVRFEFPQVSFLEVRWVAKLKCFYEGQHTIVWPMLKKLKTDGSALLKIVASEHLRLIQGNEEPVLLGEEVIPKLEELELLNFGDMDQFPPNLFQHIKVFAASDGSPFSIFPFVRRFYNLERLEFTCLDFKHVVPCKGDAGTLPPIRNLELFSEFLKHDPCIKMLKIVGKRSIFHVIRERESYTARVKLGCTFSARNLNHIWRKDSELDHILSNLQTLTVHSCDDWINIRVFSSSLQNLTILNVSFCKMMTNLVTHSVLKNLVQLTTIKVEDCTKMTEIVGSEGDCHQTIVVKEDCPRLKIFSEGVLSTPQLQRIKQSRYSEIWSWTSDLNTTIQQLYAEKDGLYGQCDFNISDTFPASIEIWTRNPQEILGIKNLSSLQFYKCSSFKYIFTPSMLLGLNLLRRIKVRECSSMEQVVREEEEAMTHKFTFLSLRSVTIESCSNLTNFHLGSQALEFPQLLKITIAECPKMTAFSSSVSRESGDASENVVGKGGIYDNTATVFSNKELVEEHQGRNQMFFSELELLWLKDLPKLTSFCFENCFEFQCLTVLELTNCPLLKTFISKCVPGDEPQIGQHLRASNLEVHNSSLLNEKVVFPSWAKLQIQNCDSLEEIIELQGLIADESQSTSAAQSIVAEAVTTKFVFPKLENLGLDKVPRLKSFYSRMHTTQWPSVKQMSIIECPKVQIVTRQCPVSQVGISNQQPLFCVNEDTFPVLEELTLKTNDMVRGICDGQLSLQCFQNLKHLNLHFFPETSTTLPYSFIRSLPILHKLVIDNASICQIVQSEGQSDQERHTSAFYQLKELSLSQLPELTLKTFEPSLLSFKNLTTLEVSRCHGFINLVACSTAKCLRLLERLSIDDCEMIEEIIACEAEEIQGGIVFPKLKYLQLSCLPCLASFSLAHHSLEFPVLLMVMVTKCPQMRNFCQGDLRTPRLEQMHLTRDEEGELQWEGDLNTTIKHMFDEMNVQNSEVTEVTDQLPKLE